MYTHEAMRAAFSAFCLMTAIAHTGWAMADNTPALLPEDQPAPEAQSNLSDNDNNPDPEADAEASAVRPIAGVVPEPGVPGAPMAMETNWYDDLLLNAFVSAAYVHNFAISGGQLNIGRLFDANNDSFKLDVAQVVLQNPPTQLGEAGFRIDAVYGQTVPTGVGNGIAALQQAIVGYIVPVGEGLRLELGTFHSRIGSEVIEHYENANDTYSHSFLFRAQPPLLTGFRMTYPFNQNVELTVLIVNGWRANTFDNNVAKTLGVQFTFNPTPFFSLRLDYLGGAEQANTGAWRHLANVVAVFRAQTLSLTLEGVLGRQIVPDSRTLGWGGVLGTLRWDIASVFYVAVRGEYFDNVDFVALPLSNLGAEVAEVTVTPSLKFSDTALFRLELRYDRALNGGGIFVQDAGPANSQTTLSGNFLYMF